MGHRRRVRLGRRDGKAKRTPVRIIQRNTENVLVAADGIDEGDMVVTEGVHVVREGAGAIAQGDRLRPTAGSPPAAAREAAR